MWRFIHIFPALTIGAAAISGCQAFSGAGELTPLGPSLAEITSSDIPQVSPTSPPTHTPQVTLTSTAAATLPIPPATATRAPVVSQAAAAPTQTLTPTPCVGQWFTPHAASGSCPDGPPAQLEAAYQTFEHGAMLWRKGRGYIILPFNPATGVQSGVITFYPDEVTIYRNTSGDYTPPDGLFAPQSGFGLVWRGDIFETPGGDLKGTLGWATAAETGYTITEQSGTVPVRVAEATLVSVLSYFTLPDSRLLRLSHFALPNQQSYLGFIMP